jgi:hypothetical protein
MRSHPSQPHRPRHSQTSSQVIHWGSWGSRRSRSRKRAGVEPAYVQRLVDVGVIGRTPDGAFTQGDARRARLCQGLERAGLPLEAIAEAVDRGGLSFAFLDRRVYDRFAGLSASSFREVSAREKDPARAAPRGPRCDRLRAGGPGRSDAGGRARADPDHQPPALEGSRSRRDEQWLRATETPSAGSARRRRTCGTRRSRSRSSSLV